MKFVIGKKLKEKKLLYTVKAMGCREQLTIAENLSDAEAIVLRYLNSLNIVLHDFYCDTAVYTSESILLREFGIVGSVPKLYSIEELLNRLPCAVIGGYEKKGLYYIHPYFQQKLDKP